VNSALPQGRARLEMVRNQKICFVKLFPRIHSCGFNFVFLRSHFEQPHFNALPVMGHDNQYSTHVVWGLYLCYHIRELYRKSQLER
jgi:hypothetical protein